MNNVIDALAQSPPSAEVTEAAGKAYVLIPLGVGEVPELTNYPYEVLMARPDWGEQNPSLAAAAARAISRWARSITLTLMHLRQPCAPTAFLINRS